MVGLCQSETFQRWLAVFCCIDIGLKTRNCCGNRLETSDTRYKRNKVRCRNEKGRKNAGLYNMRDIILDNDVVKAGPEVLKYRVSGQCSHDEELRPSLSKSTA